MDDVRGITTQKEFIPTKANGIEDFLYEEKLPLGDTYKLPDFTFKDAASGSYIIWEHLGMLGYAEYKAAWEEKKKDI